MTFFLLKIKIISAEHQKFRAEIGEVSEFMALKLRFSGISFLS
jgi:hypothetical protein